MTLRQHPPLQGRGNVRNRASWSVSAPSRRPLKTCLGERCCCSSQKAGRRRGTCKPFHSSAVDGFVLELMLQLWIGVKAAPLEPFNHILNSFNSFIFTRSVGDMPGGLWYLQGPSKQWHTTPPSDRGAAEPLRRFCAQEDRLEPSPAWSHWCRRQGFCTGWAHRRKAPQCRLLGLRTSQGCPRKRQRALGWRAHQSNHQRRSPQFGRWTCQSRHLSCQRSPLVRLIRWRICSICSKNDN